MSTIEKTGPVQVTPETPTGTASAYTLGQLVAYALRLGASVAALATFLPCYFFTIIPAPYFKRYGKRPGVIAFVDGVTAAAVGAIAGVCVVLGRRTLFDDGWTLGVPKLVLLVVTLGLLMRFKNLPEPVVILGAAAIGLVVRP